MKNKTLIKVFLIIGMVSSFYLIFPIVLGIITINKIEESNDPEEIKKWGIISLIFVNLISGLLILTSNFSEVANENANKTTPSQDSAEKLLIELKKLYDDGIIDTDFYETKRKEYLGRL